MYLNLSKASEWQLICIVMCVTLLEDKSRLHTGFVDVLHTYCHNNYMNGAHNTTMPIVIKHSNGLPEKNYFLAALIQWMKDSYDFRDRNFTKWQCTQITR